MSLRPDEELVQHARALRGIARALVGAGNADDVAQEAALQALQRPPTQVTTMFGWLSGVVRHRAQKHHRGERRRKRREQLVGERAAEAEPAPSPLAATAHRETIARLDQALLGLPQPYQDTVLLRYYEGLLPQQIAERTATPVATVKSRLQRGLTMLRERLDDGDGERGSWRAAFAVAFGLPQEVGVATWTTLGILLMTSKLMVAAMAVVILALWLWPFDDTAPPMSNVQAARDEQPAAAQAAADAAATAPRREAVVDAPPTASVAIPPNDGVTFVGRCIDEQGAPLADVVIDARTRERNGGRSRAMVELRTGDDGTFSVTLPLAEFCYQQLTLHAADRCEVRGDRNQASAGERIDVGDLVVPLARHVRGVVVDAAGTPQPGLELHLERNRDFGQSSQLFEVTGSTSRTTTGPDGTFVFAAALPPAAHFFVIGNRSLADSRLDLREGPLQRDLRLVVGAPPPRCRGVVVRSDGSPIADADVQLDKDRARTGPDGRFDLEPYPDYGRADRRLRVSASGFQQSNEVIWKFADEAEVQVVLRPEIGVVLHVVDGRTSEPVERYRARAMHPSAWQQGKPSSDGPHPGGTCRIPALPGSIVVQVVPESPELFEAALTPLKVDETRDAECTVTLWPAQQRRLVVLAGGRPVADVDVQLLDPGPFTVDCGTEAAVLFQSEVSGLPLARILHRETTDEQGTIALRGPKGTLALRLRADGFAPLVVQPVRLDAAEDLVVELPRGATLRGRLVPERVAKQLIAGSAPTPNSRPDPFGIDLVRDGGERLHGFLEPVFALEPDGSFSIRGVPAGDWHVLVGTNKRGFAAAKVTLGEGEVVQREFDVTSLEPAAITLQMLIDGAPAADASLTVFGNHATDSFGVPSRTSAYGTTDTRGELQFQSRVGECSVFANWTSPSGVAMQLTQRFQVPRAGPQTVVLDLRVGGLDLTLLRPDGAPAAGVALREQGCPFGTRWTADDAGRVRVPRIVAGTLVLEARPRSLTTDEQVHEFARRNGGAALEQAYLTVGTITVNPGAAVPQTLTLPSSWDR
ncbi:MAG: sigma-70 family RNA polymerase sigma factor [Planctomycetota bacterium]